MQEVKTVELIGPALDWAIAQIEGVEVTIAEPQYLVGWRVTRPYPYGKYSPSTDWAIGGPLIQKHGCDLNCIAAANCWEANCWDERSPNPDLHLKEGETPLIAACRAIVAAKLGDTMQVPPELLSATNE
jgi:hypothetical protein